MKYHIILFNGDSCGKSNCKMHTLQKRGCGENRQTNKQVNGTPHCKCNTCKKTFQTQAHKQRYYTPNQSTDSRNVSKQQ
ncbi:MAG: hypothetical protein LBE76_05835 [Nitrososphaerota archaeon]|nr:hypothetical protein [Nitrososphaerota archaeon]